MNLKPLFEIQKVLRDRIGYNEPDRFNKLILALLVELGECANEWRGFKFWSQDQEPRTKVGVPKSYWHEGFTVVPTNPTKGQIYEYKNPLLEEYVDGLHFILELGLEIEFDTEEWALQKWTAKNITKQFTSLYEAAAEFSMEQGEHEYISLFSFFIGLGDMLGFTWEQIEQAYIEKNKVNHLRQESGY